jgi:predicted ABC-type ATPase
MTHSSEANPIFIVKTGPPGAGKSTVSPLLHHLLKISDVVTISIDELVERYTPFSCESELIEHDESRSDKLAKLYFHHRAEVNDLLEAMLFAAMSLRLHIEFETLGSNKSYEWLTRLLQTAKRQGYRSVIAHVSISKSKLLQRLEKRNRSNRYVDPKYAVSTIQESKHNSKRLSQFADKLFTINNNGRKPVLSDMKE